MGVRFFFLILAILWPCLGHCQSANDELTIVYKGIYYKKAKVAGVTEAGVTLTSDKGRVTVPIDILPFRVQEELKQRLASAQAAARPRTTPAPGVKSTPAPGPDTATEEPEEAKKSVPMDVPMVRDIIIGGGLAFVGFLFLLGGLLGNSKKGLSLVVALLCFGGAYIPARSAYDRYKSYDWTIESAQQEAMRLYPDLAVPGTKLHSTYLSLRDKHKTEDPAFFDAPDWPIRLAHEASDSQ